MRQEWKREFRQRGVEGTRRMVGISAYHSDEKKMKAARRWLWWQDNWLTLVGAIVVLVAALIPFLLAKLWP